MLPDFTVLRPDSLTHACQLLLDHDGDAIAYAGGTELLLAMKLGFADYALMVDLKALPDLGRISVTPDLVRIGALVTHRELARSPQIADTLPSLASLEQQIANPRVRAVGTIGGNLAFGEPHSDPATYLVATGAQLVVHRADGTRRTVPAARFHRGPFETALEPGELIAEIQIPRRASRITHQRLVLTERPAVTVTTAVTVEDDTVTAATIAVGAACPVPASLPSAEETLVGARVPADRRRLAAAGAAAAGTVTVTAGVDDTYHRHLVDVLVQRSLHRAIGQ